MTISRVVAITGCDSGLGWAIAARAAREGMVTVAGMFGGVNSSAANALSKLNAHPCPLDVTNPESVESFGEFIRKLLNNNPDYRLYAVVNNAGIMTIGDYEWWTTKMIEDTINVNLLGTMKVITNLLPDLRRTALEGKVKPRMINVASHCAIQPLPGLAPYCASKAALLSLTKALRIEQSPHGVQVVAFLPGGFVGQSNIMSHQVTHGNIMLENLDDEQKPFYEERLKALISYLSQGPAQVPFDALIDQNIIETFMKTLTVETPNSYYKVEPFRYKLYHFLFKLPLPERMLNWLIKKFVNFPSK